MPSINRHGPVRILMGIEGEGRVSVDRVVPQRLANMVAQRSNGWLNADTFLFQGRTYDDGHPLSFIGSYRVTDGYAEAVAGRGANLILCGDDQWALWSTDLGYQDSFGRWKPEDVSVNDDWVPAAVHGGVIYVKLKHHGPDVYGRWDGTNLVFVDRLPTEPWQCGHVEGYGLCVWQDRRQGIVLSGDGRDFQPDLRVLDDGRVVVVSSFGAGERPHELRTYTVNPVTATRTDLTRHTVTVPEFIRCDRPMAVGAWFDHDRPFLTHVDEGTGRFPQAGPLIKGVFLDDAHSELRPQASFLAKSLQVPTYGYGDGYDKVALWGDYAILHAYLTPGETVAHCVNKLKHDIATAKVRGRSWGLAISLHRGATDDPNVYKRDEQMVLDMAAAAWALGVTEGSSFTYVFSWRQPKDGEPRDGILRWSSFAEAFRRMRAAVPDPSEWPTLPTKNPEPRTSNWRSLMAEKLYAARFLGKFLSSEPGREGIEGRDAVAGWEKLRAIPLPDKRQRFEFVESGLTLCDEGDRFWTRPAGTSGPWESFIAGVAPSGQPVAFRSDLVGEAVNVLELVEVAA